MLIYEFKAITKSGVDKQGTVKARNIEKAKKKIQAKGLFISMIEHNERIKSQNSFSFGTLIKELLFLNSNKMEL